MFVVAFEITFLLLLLVANGVFAMAEIAVVSARKARLQQRAEAGDAKAQAALDLAAAPEHFLSTIQIGITLIGIFAGAFGGATIAEQLGAQFNRVPLLAPHGDAFALGLVVLTITYLSLVIGELVPKRLALNNPEGIAAAVARPLRALSRFASPAVRLLSVSGDVALRLLRVRPSADPPVTVEEIKVLLGQGAEAGIFAETEQDLVESVFRLADRRVKSLMTPRLEIVWLDVAEPPAEIRRRLTESPYSRFPVGQKNLDNLLGIVQAKDLLAQTLSGAAFDLKACLRRPLFVPESRTALHVLELFKTSHTHLALVIDEYGAVEGLVTMNDVLEAIVGEMAAAHDADPRAVRRDDGSWLLDGTLPIAELKDIFPLGELPAEDGARYSTLAGFIMSYLGRVPSTADHFEWDGLRFEIVDMDRRRIDKVLVARSPPPAA
ncbi:MAG TPA: hemolysin family protein [Pyrinomonadaceae bacterium]|jgi:putative hemolysin|nr:hemolysin family protein [Pyrinomonadaceae bacterium]